MRSLQEIHKMNT